MLLTELTYYGGYLFGPPPIPDACEGIFNPLFGDTPLELGFFKPFVYTDNGAFELIEPVFYWFVWFCYY